MTKTAWESVPGSTYGKADAAVWAKAAELADVSPD